jgi:hypothetical protein
MLRFKKAIKLDKSMAVANEEPISVLHNLKEIKASLQKLLLFKQSTVFIC